MLTSIWKKKNVSKQWLNNTRQIIILQKHNTRRLIDDLQNAGQWFAFLAMKDGLQGNGLMFKCQPSHTMQISHHTKCHIKIIKKSSLKSNAPH